MYPVNLCEEISLRRINECLGYCEILLYSEALVDYMDLAENNNLCRFSGSIELQQSWEDPRNLTNCHVLLLDPVRYKTVA